MKAIFVLGLCLSAVLALPARDDDNDDQLDQDSRRRLKSVSIKLVDDHADDKLDAPSNDHIDPRYYYRNDDSSDKSKSSYYYRNGDSSENGKARYYYRNDDSSDNSEARYYYRNDDSSDKAKSSYYYRNDDSSDNSKDSHRNDSDNPLRYRYRSYSYRDDDVDEPLRTSDLDVLAKELDRLATIYRGQGVLKVSYVPPHVRDPLYSSSYNLGSLNFKYYGPNYPYDYYRDNLENRPVIVPYAEKVQDHDKKPRKTHLRDDVTESYYQYDK
ncbi:dentin sialophosphoprotein-like isoform X2 [Leptidea sinapis]|uniref:dentin sialophosphoprotein-like isoform X2 n=1 Tax=Leptidea sinapis TaxID=189913 RepID=UPI0021C48879|nr:dentin sialophosphoprotein-like isoform X2 [Leptidea sinapis]